MEHFRAPDHFSFDGPNVAQRWNRWEKQFNTFFTACELPKKEKDVQVAILLHTAGTDAQEIHEQFQFTQETDKKDVTKILKMFRDYCQPRKNTVYERYCFWSRNQVSDEPIDKWVKDLRTIARNCEFENQEDNMIRDKIVFGVQDSRVKERMLRETELTLEKAVEICRAAESTKSQMKEMCQQSHSTEQASISEMRTRSDGGERQQEDRNENLPRDERKEFKCYNCIPLLTPCYESIHILL